MKKSFGIAGKRNTLLYVLSFVCMVSSANCQATESQIRQEPVCPPNISSWPCYGTYEATISIVSADMKRFPVFRYKRQRFSNGEWRAESESLEPSTQAQKSTTKSYFMVMPSRVALFQGWENWETPSNAHVNEQDQIIDTLQAAFPSGPDSSMQKQQAATAVRRYVSPAGESSEKILVTAWKSEDGDIHFQYKDFGEPIGPFEVSGTWRRVQPEPWNDDYPLPGVSSNVGRQFRNVGEARRFLQQ